MKKIFYFLGIVLLIISCEQPEVGYISDAIHSQQDTIEVSRGIFHLSPPPKTEGSSYPMEWSITSITDAKGQPTTALQEKHEILTWISPFDPNTDTTLELAMKKVKLSEEPSIIMNPISGQFVFTQATKYVSDGIFHINTKVKNIRGERQLDDFVRVKLNPFVPVEFKTEMYSRLQLGKGKNVYDVGYNYSVKNDYDSKVPSVLDGSNPYITVLKISDEPKLAVKVKMVIADSYGNAIDPKKVTFNYNGQGKPLPNYHENSTGTAVDVAGTTFSLPAPPFPQYSNSYSGNNSYLMYYLTTADAFTVDKAAYEADNGVKDWSSYIDPDTGQIRNRASIRWGIKINDSGTWVIKMKIPYTKKL